MRKPLVISIAAVSGGGKTAVINCLSGMMDNASALYFDDYDFNGPEDICEWVKRGADYSEWDLTPLILATNTIIVENPESVDWLFIDYPFAYVQNEMKNYIDFAIFIDTPLDIALARRFLRDYNKQSGERIIDDLQNYLSQGRNAYLEMLKMIKPNCDMIIDGTESIETISNQIATRLRIIAGKIRTDNNEHTHAI